MNYKFDAAKYLPVLLVISLIASAMETDIAVPSFPKISDFFNVSDAMVQLTVSVNYLGYAISSVIYGPLSESYGRKKIMIVGNLIMCIGSFGCANANSIYILLIFRFIQGFGASTSAIIVYTIIADVYVGRQSTKMISQITSFLYVLVAGTPLVGGLINEVFKWQANYWIIFIISAFSTTLLAIALPETKNIQHVFSITQTIKNYKNIFLDKRFLLLGISLSIYYSVYVSFVSCASFLYTESFNQTNLVYTSHQTAIILVFSLVSMFTINIVNILGEKTTLIVSLILSVVGIVFMFCVGSLYHNFLYIEYLVTISMIIFTIGDAMIYPMLFTKALDILPDQKGIMSSSLSAVKSVISSIFVGIMSTFYNGSLLNVSFVLLIQTIILLFLITLIIKSFMINVTN